MLSRLLRHLVEHALQVGSEPLKEFAVGVEVFGKTADYDPRIDTIVRVQVRRLRARLRNHYQGHGRSDPIGFEIDKGQYGVRIVPRHLGAEPPPGIAARSWPASPLPTPRTNLIGREDELDLVLRRLREERPRLYVLTGVGGSGKTRLAIEVAERSRGDFPGGTLFVDVSSVFDREALIGVLAGAFNLREAGGQVSALSALRAHLRSVLRLPTLLVVDNFEQLLEAADVLGELLDSSVELTLLVTTRTALRLYGEHEHPLAPLEVPSRGWRDVEELARVPAVRLFLARAAAVDPRHELREDQAEALAELCVRLDGLPLAIELVAAQARLLTPAQMLERFSGHVDLPANPARDAPSRQRSLRRTIDWSHDFLDPMAQRVLRRASAFAGSFTVEAAQAVVDSPEDIGASLMPALSSLVSMGLVYCRENIGEPRFAMLETLRAYAQERLQASGEAGLIRRAHAAYCLVLAEEGLAASDGEARARWLERCDLEQDNFRVAIRELLERPFRDWALRFGHALYGYWERRERHVEGARILQLIVERSDPQDAPALWAKVGSYAAAMTAFDGDQRTAIAHYSGILDIYRRIGDRRGEAATLNALGACARFLGDHAQARSWFLSALDLCRSLDEPGETAAAVSNVARCELSLGQFDAADELFAEAHAIFVALDDAIAAAWALNHRGDVACAGRRHADADAFYRRAEDEFRRHGDAWGVARTLADRGRLAIDAGSTEVAAALLADALASFAALDHLRGMVAVVGNLARLAMRNDDADLALRLDGAAEAWRNSIGFRERADSQSEQAVTATAAQARVDTGEARRLREDGAAMTPLAVIDLARSRFAATRPRRPAARVRVRANSDRRR